MKALFLFSRKQERQNHSNIPFEISSEQRTSLDVMLILTPEPLKLARPLKSARARRGSLISSAVTVLPSESRDHQCLAHCHIVEENTQLICIHEDPLWICMQLTSKG